MNMGSLDAYIVGMPSGLCCPLGLGIYTRLTGSAVYSLLRSVAAISLRNPSTPSEDCSMSLKVVLSIPGAPPLLLTTGDP
jgi:hypothetical protein